MEQLVRVKQTYPDGTALVVHLRESACSGDCHKCSGCGAAKEAILFKADNPIGAKTGDLVNIRSETGPVLKAAAVLYMLPLVLFFAGYAFGAALGSSGALWGGLAFALSIIMIVVYDRHMAKNDNTIYTITDFAGDSLLKSMKKGDNDLG
ncbi:MAG: SoxR reducing system RseC family protein [Oscillospiraceae bacterium]|nr:SoxR reducing system RseC family protein [Oscillospiraceae bacterium]